MRGRWPCCCGTGGQPPGTAPYGSRTPLCLREHSLGGEVWEAGLRASSHVGLWGEPLVLARATSCCGLRCGDSCSGLGVRVPPWASVSGCERGSQVSAQDARPCLAMFILKCHFQSHLTFVTGLPSWLSGPQF